MQKTLFIIILTFALLMLGCTKPEETGTIFGTVTDFATGEPIENADVSIYPGTQSLQTSYDGQFAFSDLPSGQYMVSCQKTGYVFNRATVNVEGNSVCIVLTMRKN